MKDFLFQKRLYFFAPPDDGGGSGDGSGGGDGGSGEGGGDGGGSDSHESAVAANNESIKNLSQQISGGGDGEGGDPKDPMERHLGFFPEDDGEGDAPYRTGEDGDGGDGGQPTGQGEDPGQGEKPKTKTKEQPEGGKGEEGKTTGDGGEGEESDKFYDPDRDADNPDHVYPNAYDERIDAQMAVAAKVDRMDELTSELEENDSKLGAVIDPDLKERIEKFRDYTYTGEVSDEELKNFIMDVDKGIKATQAKVERVTTKAQQSKQKREAEKKRNRLKKDASQASQEIGLNQRITELPEDAQLDDVMELTDEVIESNLEDVNQEIEEHRQDEEYAEENGIKAYNARMDQLQAKKQERLNELQDYRETIKDYWKAEEEYQTVQKQDTELTDAQKWKERDKAFFRFKEDRSEGPTALPVFSESKDVAPIKSLRQFAYHPENVQKYDLMSEEGWLRAHNDWQDWVQSQKSKERTSEKKEKSKQKRESQYDEEIPAPGSNGGYSNIPAGADERGLSETNKNISKLAKSIMGG